MAGKKITIYELADLAGVSIATISRVMNANLRSKVKTETLERIDQLVKKYQYTPSIAAKHLTGTATKTIGVLFPHHDGMLRSEYYSEILAGISDCLFDSEYRFKMVLLKPGKWDKYDFKNSEGVDGLIMTYWRTFFSSEKVFAKMKTPCVILNNYEKGVQARFVAGDHFLGGKMAAEYLYERGHRNIVVIGGSYKSPDSEQRLRGFQRYLQSRKLFLAPGDFYDVNYTEEGAYAVTPEILQRKPAVSAVFCMNDRQAFGVLQRLEDLKVTCPQRLSVMGYDDDRRSAYCRPALTTVRVPVYDMAKQAAKDLITYLQNGGRKAFEQPSFWKPELIERQSVRKVSGLRSEKSTMEEIP